MSNGAGKIKVMGLVPSMRTGGAERVISLLLQHLDRELFDLELAIVYDAHIAYQIPDDVPVTVLANEPAAEGFVGLPPLPPDLAERFSDSHEWMSAVAGKLCALAWRSRPDVIISSPMWASILASVSYEGLPPGTLLVNRVDAPPSVSLAQGELSDLLAYYTRTYFNNAARVIAVSKAVGRDVVENFGVDEALVQPVPNPVDIAKIESLAVESVDDGVFAPDVPTVVYVGRVERVKGLRYLVRAMSKVVDEMPAQLVLVGDGSRRAYLEALAVHLGIASNVKFVGRHTNPFKFMHRGTCFVLPSLSEGMPNVLLEAMASGCPVIASDIRGGICREVLEDGACGQIVPLEDDEALAQAILCYLKDGSLRERMVAAGTARVVEFDLPRVMRQNQELLLDVVKARDMAADTRSDSPPFGAVSASRASAPSFDAGHVMDVVGSRPASLLATAKVAFGLLRRVGISTFAARSIHAARYQICRRLPARGVAPRLDRPPVARSDGRTELMVLVPSFDDDVISLGTVELLKRIDRNAFRTSLVSLRPGRKSRLVPRDIQQYTARPGCRMRVAQQDAPGAGSPLSRTEMQAVGVRQLIEQLGAECVLAEGEEATIVAGLAAEGVRDRVRVVSSLRYGAFAVTRNAAPTRAVMTSVDLRPDRFIVSEEQVGSDVVKWFGVEPETIEVIPDCVDLASLGVGAAAGSTATEANPYFVYFVESDRNAELTLVAQAIASAASRDDITCLVVGDESERSAVEELAQDLSISQSLRFRTVGDDTHALIVGATALIHMRAATDQVVPLSVMQALSEACPVIVSSAAHEAAALVGEDVCGLVVAANDYETLSDSMLRLQWDEGLRSRLGARGPERLRPLTPDHVIPRIESIIAPEAPESA